MDFEPGLLVFYIICLIAFITLFIFYYSYVLYNKQLLYKKITIRTLELICSIFLLVIFLALAIGTTCLQYVNDQKQFQNNLYVIYLG